MSPNNIFVIKIGFIGVLIIIYVKTPATMANKIIRHNSPLILSMNFALFYHK